MDKEEYFQKIRDIPWDEILAKFGWRVHKGKHGLDYTRMKCVFHREKHASLVFRNSGYYHCCGCGQGGDVFDFIRKILRNNSGRTYRFFKKEFGIEPPHKEQ